MNQQSSKLHLSAVIFFAVMSVASFFHGRLIRNDGWQFFSVLSLGVALLAWTYYRRDRRCEKEEQELKKSIYPEGQVRLIDNGQLPNCFNPRVDLREFECCHFSTKASRVFFYPPSDVKVDFTKLVIRLSGGAFYFITHPQEILLPALIDEQTAGELIITSQRILFLAPENGFEIPLQNMKQLDCSAHLIDFQVRGRRYTIQTDAAGYADKVLQLLQKQNLV